MSYWSASIDLAALMSVAGAIYGLLLLAHGAGL